MIVIGGTQTTYSVLNPEFSFLSESWLTNAEEIQASHDEVKYFCAIQVDGRGITPFARLIERIENVGGEWWTYSLADGRTKVTGENRGRHLCTGLNLVSEYATSVGATHLLRCEADVAPAVDVIPKLLAVNNGIAASACSTYFSYDHPSYWTRRPEYDFPVVSGLMTAACVLIERELFKSLKWRWDKEAGQSDDPAFSYDAQRFFGVDTLTRLDCVCSHFPAAIGPIDTRYGSHVDMTIH